MKKIIICSTTAILITLSVIAVHKNRVGKDDENFLDKTPVEQFRILRKKYGVPDDNEHKQGEIKKDENADVDQTRRDINVLLNGEDLNIKKIETRVNDLENYLNNLKESSWPGAKDYRDLIRHALSSGESKEVRTKDKDKENNDDKDKNSKDDNEEEKKDTK